MTIWGDETVADVRDMLRKVGAFDQGILAAATDRTNANDAGSKISLSVFNNMEYATVIEWGRTPGKKWPSAQSLVGWAVRRGILKTIRVNDNIDRQYKEQWMTAIAITKRMWISKAGGGKNKKSEAIDPVVRDLVVLRLIQRRSV